MNATDSESEVESDKESNPVSTEFTAFVMRKNLEINASELIQCRRRTRQTTTNEENKHKKSKHSKKIKQISKNK